MSRTRFIASPNHGPRPSDLPVDMLVLHYTGMAEGTSALDWLCRPQSEVSAHYLVEENGQVCQLVAEERRAWHAGVAAWRGQSDINGRSVGIEIVNPGHEYGYRAFPPVQIEAVVALCQGIMA
ncbi:MAG: N-acetylmuramoyl-L-alanine amidase, partial [Alphaproteobacteria bacterium]